MSRYHRQCEAHHTRADFRLRHTNETGTISCEIYDHNAPIFRTLGGVARFFSLASASYRCALHFFALTADPALLVVVQMPDGLSRATLGVLTTLVIADLAKGTGRFNLAQGLVGTLSGIGASLSTSISGLVVEQLGHTAGFLSVTTAGLIAVAILWMFMPETKPSALPVELPTARPVPLPSLRS